MFCLALWPHVQWVLEHDAVTFKYVEEQGTEQVYLKGLLTFALAPLLYWLPAWLTTVFVGAWALYRLQPGSRWASVAWRWAYTSWRPHGWGDTLYWLAFFPWAATLVFGATGFVNLSTAWAIPIGYAFPLLWLRNFQLQARHLGSDRANPWAALDAFVYPGLLGMLCLSVFMAWSNAHDAEAHYYRPDRNVSNALLSDWKQRHPEMRLQWVGGDWAESALLSFYGDSDLVVIPDLPGSKVASYYPSPDLNRQAGLIFCSLGPVDAIPSDAPRLCEAQARQWLQARSLPVQPITFHIQRHGWRFPMHVPFEYVVFHVIPH